ncbi:MAG: hypothetical protein MO846_06125 [Candidatus Devosia symbiotica]|nr:hypothetical protein [Candidatus Devosia symbiotica]
MQLHFGESLLDAMGGVCLAGPRGQAKSDVLIGAQMFEQTFRLQQQGYWPALGRERQQIDAVQIDVAGAMRSSNVDLPAPLVPEMAVIALSAAWKLNV